MTAAFITSSLPAHAQDDQFRGLVDRGMQAYKARQYQAAVDAFESAFAIRPEPELVFNVARAYEKSLNSEKALENYERFLRLQGTTAELRARALDSVRALRSEQRARARATRPPPPPPPAVSKTPRPAAEVRRPILEQRDRTLEWSLIGGGAAVAAAGGVFALLAAMDNSEFEDTATPADQKQGLKDSIERNALIADILVPVGVVTAGVGLILYLVNPDEQAVAVSPMVTPDGGGGLAFGGRF